MQGDRFAGPLSIIRNWTYALFYVMAELWGSVVVSVLFWGFANTITTVDEAKQFYPLFGLGANVALIFSGQAVKYFSAIRASLPEGVDGWGISLRGMMSMVAGFGCLIAGIYWWMNRKIVPNVELPGGPVPKKKKKASMSGEPAADADAGAWLALEWCGEPPLHLSPSCPPRLPARMQSASRSSSWLRRATSVTSPRSWWPTVSRSTWSR